MGIYVWESVVGKQGLFYLFSSFDKNKLDIDRHIPGSDQTETQFPLLSLFLLLEISVIKDYKS